MGYMNFLSFLAVATATFLLGFLLGLCFGGRSGGAALPLKPLAKRTSISREFENFLTYDGSVQ
jgi:hypothetical protein